MAKKINQLDLDYINNHTKEHRNHHIDKRLYITMSANGFASQNINIMQPYRINEGRIVFFTQGEAQISINLENYTVKKNMVTVNLPNTIFELIERSDDFDFMACSFPVDLPIVSTLDSTIVIKLNDDQTSLITEYFNLMWHEAHQPNVLNSVIDHLQMAMLLEMYRLNQMQHIMHDNSESREYVTLHKFINLVLKHSISQRNIPFYADILCLTPNHLGAIIKRASGLTAMQWIHRFIIQEAKVQLKYSDLSILEISEMLNFPNPSFFSKYFKRETGLTPNEYRQLSN